MNFRAKPGFSLLEILLSLTLGSMILLGLSKWFSDYFYNQHKHNEVMQLQQHTHQLLTYLRQHIQHIGYQGVNREQSNYDLFLYQGKSMRLASPDCLTFFYDVNGDGCVGTRNRNNACQLNGLNHTNASGKELFGFKFEKGQLYILDKKNVKRCYRSQCQEWASACQSRSWKKFLEHSDYQIEKLTFEWEKPEVLLNITIKLSSVLQPNISYQANIYAYLLNAGE